MSVLIKRRPPKDEHEAQKWLVLEGSIEGCPEVTKVRSINVAALVDGGLNLADEKAALIADVEEYHARYLALQEALKEL